MEFTPIDEPILPQAGREVLEDCPACIALVAIKRT